MRQFSILFLLLALITAPSTIAQVEDMVCAEPLEQFVYTGAVQRGGLYLPSEGAIRALVVFVQFRGDTFHPNSTQWPVNQPPEYFNTFLDSTADQPVSATGNLSHYYREMSFDRLRLYGDPYFVITQHTEAYYRDTLQLGNSAFGEVNREVLQTLDGVVDYGLYDNWTSSAFNHVEKPDHNVDLIIMFYRITGWPPDETGIAIIGWGNHIETDDGVTIRYNFPGSGITNGGGVYGQSLYSTKHEIGHLLFGGGHPSYSNVGNYNYWGIMSSSRHLPANAWERERLGWINFDNVEDNQTSTLADFVTTGHAYRIVIPNTGIEEAFIVENHQKLSIFDNPNFDRPGKGLFILHVRGFDVFLPWYDIEVAEGKFNWANPYWIPMPFGPPPPDSLPVFVQGLANRTGYDGRDNPLTSKNSHFPIYFIDSSGVPLHVDRFNGSPKDAFNIGYNQVFSPWSNPTSHSWNNTQTTIAVEITGKSTGASGEDIFTLKFFTSSPEGTSPSKPQAMRISLFEGEWGYRHPCINWSAMLEPDVISGGNILIHRRTLQSEYSPPTWSSWSLHATISGTDTQYIDMSISTAGVGYDSVQYRIQAKDNTAKFSVYSDIVSMNMSSDMWKVNTHQEGIPATFALYQNYPNPFNPSTRINFDLPEPANVSLIVFDVLGREVATLATGYHAAGYHSVMWSAPEMASGVYFARFTATDKSGEVKYAKVNKLALTK